MRATNLIIASISVMAVILLPSLARKKTAVYLAPGVVQVDQQLYMDQTEVSNFHWREYLYWIGKIYGDTSVEYKAALPDTSLWKNELNLEAYEHYYLRHRAYCDYPVVGLSYKQMVNYCSWRSDRVFEYMLIREEIIAFDTSQTPAHHFSIENYFSGKYGDYKTGDYHPPIPHYYLPGEEEWKKAEAYSQAIYLGLTKRQMKRSPAVYYNNYAKMYPTKSTRPIAPRDKYCIKGALYNMHHNVSEQLSDSTRVAGENWKGTASLTEGDVIFDRVKPSTSVGFRCAFMWK